MFAASQLDLVMGLDIHIEMIPILGVPTPTPFPMMFLGQLELSPGGALLKMGMAKVSSAVFGSPPTGPVFVNGFPAGKTGDEAKNATTMPHILIPPGAAWMPLPRMPPPAPNPGAAPSDPGNPAVPPGDAMLVMGSKTVYFEGSNAVRLGLVAMSCNDPVRLPNCTVIAIPKGMPVIVGGPPAFDWSATLKAVLLRNKFAAGFLHSLVSRMEAGRWRDAAAWAVCHFTGHPVDVATGRVLTRATDFTLRGPIPIEFQRIYSTASSDRWSPIGYGWSHALDEHVWEEPGKVVYKTGDGREIEFHCFHLPKRQMRKWDTIFHPIERLTLTCHGDGIFTVRGRDGLEREFARTSPAWGGSSLRKISSRNGQWVRLDYQETRLDRVETSEGRWLQFQYRKGGLLESVRLENPTGDGYYTQVSYRYSAEGDLIEIADSGGRTRKLEYENHLLVREEDRDGVTFFFVYDGRDENASCTITWGTDNKGQDRLFFRELTYDKEKNVTIEEDSLGNETVYQMNFAGAVVEVRDAHGAKTQYEYNDFLWKLSETNALGGVTRFEYDERGNETKRVLPNGAPTTVLYNERDQPVSVVDALGGRSDWSYDAKGRVKQYSTPKRSVAIQYGEPSSEIASRQEAPDQGTYPSRMTIDGDRVFAFEHNGAGEVTRIVFPDTTSEERWYDKRGRLTKVRDGAGRARRFYYDIEDRLTQVEFPGGIVKSMQYSAEGDLTSYRDATRHVSFAYRGYHKLAWREEGGQRLEYAYTSEDQLIAVFNEVGERYVFARDACGRIQEEIGFDGRKHTYLRNKMGWVAKHTRPSKKVETFEHDAMGKVTRVAYPDRTEETFTYDLRGDLLTATNATGTVQNERNQARQLVGERFNEEWVASAYERGSGARSEITSSLGLAARITRSKNGDVKVVGLWKKGGPAVWGVAFERDSVGNETKRTMPGGVTASVRRNDEGLQIEQVVTVGETVEARTEFEWQGDNRLTKIRRDGARVTSFEHDGQGRLAAAHRADGTTQWRAPGPSGNLFKTPERRDRRYGKGGVLLQDDRAKYAYDLDGNLMKKMEPDGSTWVYEWNGAGMLAAVLKPDGTKVEFEYDALRRRVKKNVGETSTRWVWDGNTPIHEVTGDGTTTWVFDPGTFAPLGKIAPDGKKYGVVTDYLGTPTEMFDAAGKLAWKAQLDIYGMATVSEGEARDCPWRWPGQYEDSETGLYYNRFRYYDAGRGNYCSQDPLRLQGGPGAYGYPLDPSTFMDPLGLSACIGVRTQYGPMDQGPLDEQTANSFRGGSYDGVVLADDTLLYRVYGGSARPIGGFWTTIEPLGPVQAQLDLALMPAWGNSAANTAIISVPAGTTVFEGFAAPQPSGLGGTLLGGGSQVVIPKVDPSWRIK